MKFEVKISQIPKEQFPISEINCSIDVTDLEDFIKKIVCIAAILTGNP